METDRKLTSQDEITVLIRNHGIETWQSLISFVKKLPYGRNTNRINLALVISEKRGSCSSKHALLKKVANLNDIPNIELILGLYKMDNNNTPAIGDVLKDNGIDFILEAHCYLKINDERMDVTTPQSHFRRIEKDIVTELTIKPEQVVEFKVNYHKGALKNWIHANNIDKTFNEIWSIREQCITNLSK